VLGVAAVAIAALVRPSRTEGAATSRGAAPTPLEVRTPEGFVVTTAANLLGRVRSSATKGTVIGVWASWCGSCKPELPMFVGLKKTFAGSVDVELVSVDEADGLARAKQLLDDVRAPDPRYVVGEPLDRFKTAMNPKWPGMLPATFLFDRTGRLVYFWGGPVYENEITPLLRRFLAGEHVDGESNFALAPGAVTR